MENFKVGDRVVCVNMGRNTYLTEGREYTVASLDSEGIYTTEGIYGHSHRFKKVGDKAMRESKGSKENRGYTFNVSSPTAISLTLVKRDLSYSHPVAILTYGENTHVVIHNSLLQKLDHVDPILKRKLRTYWIDSGTPVLKSNLSKIIAVLKEVKRAQYLPQYAGKYEVHVEIPKI